MSDYLRLANRMREHAMATRNDVAGPRHAEISSYDPTNHAVKVILQPSDPDNQIESNWMPLGSIGVGNGFGFAIGPNIGDQVMVVFPEGDFESGTIVARVYDVDNQAIAVPSGEIWAVHKSGSSLKFLTNGDVQMVVVGNYTETVTGTATRTATAHQIVGPVMTDKTIAAGGDITDNTASGNTKSMYSMREEYDIHYHVVTGIQTGSSQVNSNAPFQQI